MNINNETELNKEIGKRLKLLIKEYDKKQTVTASFLHVSEVTVSRYCTGKCKLPIEIAEKLSKHWKIRKEYILCKDDFKTDEEMLKYANEIDNEAFIYQKKYLETLGFKMNLSFSMFCNKSTIYKKKNELLPYLREDSYNEIINDKDYQLSYKDFFKKHISSDLTVLFLKKPLEERLRKELESINKNTIIGDSDSLGLDSYEIPSNSSFLNENYIFNVYFTVFYQNKYIGDFKISKIQEVFKIIDAYTKCTIETLLVYDYKLFNEYNDY